MSRNLLPDGVVDRTGLRRWFWTRYGVRPSWHTISEAIRQGLPCQPHPLLAGRLFFDLPQVEAWVEERQKALTAKAS